MPAQGASGIESLGGPFFLARFAAMYAFCNGMTRERRRFISGRLYPESVAGIEEVDRSAMPECAPHIDTFAA